MLSKVRVPIADIMVSSISCIWFIQLNQSCERKVLYYLLVNNALQNSVLALDDSSLDGDQVDNLIKFCPSKEEMELLKVPFTLDL